MKRIWTLIGGAVLLAGWASGQSEVILIEDHFETNAVVPSSVLLRDRVGFCKYSSSVWEMSGGVLRNTSTVNTTVSEGAAAQIISLASITNAAFDRLSLSFDYTQAEANEKLYVYLWGYVDKSSTPATSIMNLGASNGNAWENASPTDMTGYNLGKYEGVFISPEGIASDAAVSGLI